MRCFALVTLAVALSGVLGFTLQTKTQPISARLSSSNVLRPQHMLSMVDYDAGAVAQMVEKNTTIEREIGSSSMTGRRALYAEDTVDIQLFKDIELLSDYLGDIVKRGSPEAYEVFQRFKNHALARNAGDYEALGRMVRCDCKRRVLSIIMSLCMLCAAVRCVLSANSRCAVCCVLLAAVCCVL
jgi:hypothetical protein